MQWALAVFVNHHAILEQIVIEHARGKFCQQHVGLALHDQLHLHATARRVTDLAKQAIAGEEIRVGDHHPLPGLAQGVDIRVFDVVTMLDIVAVDQAYQAVAWLVRPG